MSAATLKPGPSSLSTTDAEKLTQRATAIAKREIGFIPSPSFAKHSRFQECPLDSVREIELGNVAAPNVRAGGLPAHLARMCATPLLTPEEESALFERMNYCKFWADRLRRKLRPQKPSLQIMQQYDEVLARSERLRNYLLQANTRLVMSIARKFADARNPFDDLLSQGIASLMHSVEKFDYDRGYRFSTYATCAVRRELYRMVMNNKKLARRFASGSGAVLDGCCEEEAAPESAQASVSNYRHLCSAVQSMMSELDEREQIILSARFGLDQARKKSSYSKLGGKLGISKERVRQLANRAMEKLRELVPQHQLERYLD